MSDAARRKAVAVGLAAAGAAVWLLVPARAAADGLEVSADFAGGAVKVLAVDQQTGTILFQVPAHPGGGWRKWWYFKVTGIRPGQVIRLVGPEPDRPVYSLDGKTWRFTSGKAKDGQKIDATQAWFAWYVPFVPSDTDALIDRAVKACPQAKRFELCRSEDGIGVAGLRIAECGGDDPKCVGIWIQARQHAWEVGGSWTVAGIAEWLVGDDALAKQLRKRAAVTVVPIMDVDSVVKGRGGKDQKPHDHNRDWSDKPHWKSVAAAMAQIRKIDAAGRLHMFLDFHDPGYAGRFSIFCNLDGQPEVRVANSKRFAGVLADECRSRQVNWRFGGLNPANYLRNQPAAGTWVKKHCRDRVVAGSPEIPVGLKPLPADVVPPQPHLRLGAAFGAAIARYFGCDEKAEKVPAR